MIQNQKLILLDENGLLWFVKASESGVNAHFLERRMERWEMGGVGGGATWYQNTCSTLEIRELRVEQMFERRQV